MGVATFPGMKDAYDQLDQIFRVHILSKLSTPCLVGKGDILFRAKS